MSKLITTSLLSRFWTNAKSYIDTALTGKASSTHTHAQTDVTGLADALSGKASSTHTHSEYAASSHAHSYTDLSDKPTIPTTVAQLTDAGNYALKSEIPDSVEIATEAEIDALFA